MSASLEASFRIPLHNGRKWHNILTWNGCAYERRQQQQWRDIIGARIGILHSIYNVIIVRTCFRTSFVCVKLAEVAKQFGFTVVIMIIVIIDAVAAVIVVSTFNWLMILMIKSVRLTEKKNNQHTLCCRNSYIISWLTNNLLLMYLNT